MVLILTIVSLIRHTPAAHSLRALFPRGPQAAECFLIKTYGPSSNPSLFFLFHSVTCLLERGVWLQHLMMFSWRLFLFFFKLLFFLSCSIYLHLPRWPVRLLSAIALDSPLRISSPLMPLYRPLFWRPSLPSIISFMWLFRRHDPPTTFLGLSTLTTLSYLSAPFPMSPHDLAPSVLEDGLLLAKFHIRYLGAPKPPSNILPLRRHLLFLNTFLPLIAL